MVFAESLVITHLVPLVTLGGSKDRKMIIGAEIFNDSRCEGNPETSREFRNSIGKCTAWDSSSRLGYLHTDRQTAFQLYILED